MKTCTKCGVSKEETEFRSRKTVCKGCCRANDKAYYIKNRKEISAKQKIYRIKNKEQTPNKQREYRYGLLPGDFNQLLSKQEGVCAICGGSGGGRGFCVDHDHDSGKVRGLLCVKCNSAIGLLNDSSVFTQLATEYLKQHGK